MFHAVVNQTVRNEKMLRTLPGCPVIFSYSNNVCTSKQHSYMRHTPLMQNLWLTR